MAMSKRIYQETMNKIQSNPNLGGYHKAACIKMMQEVQEAEELFHALKRAENNVHQLRSI